MKFQAGDIVIAESGPWSGGPTLILGPHEFPGGIPAYRLRSILPQHCMVDDAELWPTGDSYMKAEYIDQFKLLWRKT